MKTEKPLLPKVKRFVAEYLVDLNGRLAAKRAGYRSHDNASQRLLAREDVQEAIKAAQREREKRTLISQDKVLRELSRIAFFDVRKIYQRDGELKQITELDDDTAGAVAGVDVSVELADGVRSKVKKFKIHEKVSALSLVMRHLGMLQDKTEVSGPGGKPLMPPAIKVYLPDNGRDKRRTEE